MKPRDRSDEQIVGDALRNLPTRRAPASLEQRVSLALQRGEHSVQLTDFRSWTLIRRGAFFAVCGVIVAFTAYLGPWALAASLWQSAGAVTLSRLHAALAPAASVYQAATVLVRLVPPDWWYGLATLGGLCYAALFGLGAAAYRTLYFQPMGRGST